MRYCFQTWEQAIKLSRRHHNDGDDCARSEQRTDGGEVRQFTGELKINYPIALGTKETKSLFDQSETLPLTNVIVRDGNIRERIEGILLP